MQAGQNFSHQASNTQGYPVFNMVVQTRILPGGRPDRNLFDAVRYASEDDFVAMMKSALADGAKLDAVDEQNKSLLEVAVSRNSARILQALVAQGAPLPNPDASGFDLLMHAAITGNVQMMDLLMDAYELLPDATDNGGWTALHYAAMSGSPAALEALLRRDLDCNASAKGTDHNSLCQVAGENYGLRGHGLTPLNIAVVSGNPRSVQVLLEHGAQILRGDANALLTAVRCEDPATLEILLAHGKRTGNLSVVLTDQVLSQAMMGGDSTQMLRLLLDCHRTHPVVNLDLDDAISTAVWRERVDQLELLLDAGARPVPSDRSYWSYANSAEDRNIIDLLTASCNEAFDHLIAKPEDGSPASLLTELPKYATDPVALSQHGIFITPLNDANTALVSLNRDSDTLCEAQIAAETAHILLRFLTLPPQPNSDRSDKQTGRHETLVKAEVLQRERAAAPPSCSAKIQQVSALRCSQMLELARSQTDALHNALSTYLSAKFFSDVREAAGEDNMVASMEHQLREVSGIPDALVSLITDTWTEANDLIVNNADRSAAPDAAAVSRLMAATLFCKLDHIKFDFDNYLALPKSLLHDCIKKLRIELAPQRASWSTLITHPANFLRKLEGRTGLSLVDVRSLTLTIVTATGLPMNVCASLASCWQRAVVDARGAPDTGSASQRFQRLDQAFAGYWQEWLEENAYDAETVLLPFTPQEVLQSIEWCSQTRQAQQARPASEESRKRKAGADPEGARPPKPPRL